jgi:predicted nucleic acid-binding protein
VILADASVVLDFCGMSPDRLRRAQSTASFVAESGESLVVTEVVLAEVFWVLASAYSLRGTDAVDVVESLLSSAEFVAWDDALAACALGVKRRTPELDIADCILASRVLLYGNEVATSDRVLTRTIEAEVKRWESA